jgi:hypothetical protein
MRYLALCLSASLILALTPLGCGGDRAERGLSPPDEEATPLSEQELQESEAERQGEVIQNEQTAESEEFDEEESQ